MRRCNPTDIIFGEVSPSRFEPLEGVDDVVGEVGAVEARGVVILHVVGVEGVGQHQVRLGRATST